MSKLRIANMIAAASVVTTGLAAAQAPAEQSHPHYRNAASVTLTTGCDKLVGKNCEGSNRRVEWRFAPHHGLGETRFGIEQFRESIGNHFYNRRFDKSYGSAHIDLNWALQAEGTRATFDQAFRLGQNAQAEIGVYVGRVKADLTASAKADLILHPQTITIPSQTIGGHSTPPLTLNYAGDAFNASSNWGKHAASYDGGLRGAAGWSMALPSPRLRAGVNGFGEVSLLRTMIGGGASLYYSSSPDDKLGTGPGGECAGSPLRSSAQYAFALGACVTQLSRDSLIDLKTRYAGRVGERINGRINEANAKIDQIGQEYPIVAGQKLPVLERPAAQVSEALGFVQDYKRVRSAFVDSAAARIGQNGAVSVSHLQMQDDSRTSVTFAYQFK